MISEPIDRPLIGSGAHNLALFDATLASLSSPGSNGDFTAAEASPS